MQLDTFRFHSHTQRSFFFSFFSFHVSLSVALFFSFSFFNVYQHPYFSSNFPLLSIQNTGQKENKTKRTGKKFLFYLRHWFKGMVVVLKPRSWSLPFFFLFFLSNGPCKNPIWENIATVTCTSSWLHHIFETETDSGREREKKTNERVNWNAFLFLIHLCSVRNQFCNLKKKDSSYLRHIATNQCTNVTCN